MKTYQEIIYARQNDFNSHNYCIEKGKKVPLKKEQYIQLEWCRLKAS